MTMHARKPLQSASESRWRKALFMALFAAVIVSIFGGVFIALAFGLPMFSR